MADPKKMQALGSSFASERNVVRHESPAAIDADFHEWLLDQASALREQRLESIDWQHLAEELEAMAASEGRVLKNQLKRLLMHLLKMREQPEQLSRHGSWRRSIRDARQQIEDLLADSPGILQGRADELVAQAYKRARIDASEDTKLPLKNFPEDCPWPFEEIIREDFFPGVPRQK